MTPFYDVFLSVHLNSVPVDLEEEIIFSIEADCFWCFSSLVDTIQDNYTFSQAGILRQIDNLTQLIWRTDGNCSAAICAPN